MNQKWTRAICTVLTSALVFTGPAVEGTTFSGYINSGLEKVYAKTQKQKDAEKKKSQAEQDLKDKKNEINGLKDQQQITADDIKNKSAKLDEILAAQKKLQTDITSKQAEIEQNQKDLAAAQEKQQEQYDAMKKRIQFMYENSAEDNIWTAIIESNGITDMLNRIEYVSDVYDSDRALMDSYQAAVEQVKEIGTKLDKDMNELTAMQDDYEKQQADVEAAIVALENQKEQYASQIAQAQQQADNYQNIITAQGKIIQEQEAAAAAAAAAQAAAARANSSSSSSSYDGGGAGKGGSIAGDYAAGGGKNPGASTGVSGSSVVSYAMQFVGHPYVWGGNSLTNGVDCSGFVHEVYAHFGISTPRYSQAFKSVGQAVSFDNIQPGDVVVYPGHVAIYAGGGVIVEAQSTKAGITANRSVQCHTILAIRRLV
ncbi:NlpC/P60 family protein [Agathobacter rectalis]|uniref:Gamma-DL-glutamyl hydrolase n=1 Tax=Agathobacter rectalis TaxID=39491 RepID=A0A173SQ00_9FIRM|nr:C40 family peptidase [Agathobacter rectalis]CUM92310.1 Gamma-DL-glutamyl hydrolase precursor [Agathobacter rectalis]CUN18796.1 Gamma-DL-glutamyl hydrolase precursor [[Ruminococcus] torques]